MYRNGGKLVAPILGKNVNWETLTQNDKLNIIAASVVSAAVTQTSRHTRDAIEFVSVLKRAQKLSAGVLNQYTLLLDSSDAMAEMQNDE